MQKLVSFCVFDSSTKDIVQKVVIRSNNILLKNFINFIQRQLKTSWKNDEKKRKFAPIWANTLKNDLLTLHLGLPSSCTTLSNWKTTKAILGLLMKFDDIGPYLFIPFWKIKVMKIVWKHLTKKRQSPNTFQMLDCQKRQSPKTIQFLDCKNIARSLPENSRDRRLRPSMNWND